MIAYFMTTCCCRLPASQFFFNSARDDEESGFNVELIEEIYANPYLAFPRIIEGETDSHPFTVWPKEWWKVLLSVCSVHAHATDKCRDQTHGRNGVVFFMRSRKGAEGAKGIMILL